MNVKILIVDDSKTDIALIKNMLSDYDLSVAYDGIEAMEFIKNNPDIDMILLDLNMPRMNGFEVLEALQKKDEYKKIATLILTNYDEIENEVKGLNLGAQDYIRKPLNLLSLRKRIEVHSNLSQIRKYLEQHNAILEQTVQERTKELVLTRDMTIHALSGLLEVRDIESSNHTFRTQLMMKTLSEHLSKKKRYKTVLTESYIRELFSTTPLHDIGKVGIPDSILLKPGKLTFEEFELMKQHTTYGVNALKYVTDENYEFSFMRTAIDIIATHHEKFDGSGYPSGLAGEEIPLAGRLMAIIDVYDALVNERVYKPAFSSEEALEIIRSERGRHFDPDIVDAFLEIKEDIRHIAEKYA